MNINPSQFDIPALVADRAINSAICATGGVPRHLLIADMSQPSIAARLWVLDLSDRADPQLVMRTQVAHGFGSDPKRDGMATRFSDIKGSSMTSMGLYAVGQEYVGKHGRSYRLAGMSSSNAAAYTRNIMLHPADYVSPTHVGHSAGCAAVANDVIPTLEKRWGTIQGAYLWIDGPGAPSISCAAIEPPWAAGISSGWPAFPSIRACAPESQS